MTPYCTIVNNVHSFRVLNFQTGHTVRKYINYKSFLIYGNIDYRVEERPPIDESISSDRSWVQLMSGLIPCKARSIPGLD